MNDCLDCVYFIRLSKALKYNIFDVITAYDTIFIYFNKI